MCIICYIVWNPLRVDTDRFSSRAYGYIQFFSLANNSLTTQPNWKFFSLYKVSEILFGFYWFCMDEEGCCWRHQRTSSYEKVFPMLKLKCMKICCVEMHENLLPLTSFWYLYCQLWTFLTPCSSVSIVNFEQVNAVWESNGVIYCFCFVYLNLDVTYVFKVTMPV